MGDAGKYCDMFIVLPLVLLIAWHVWKACRAGWGGGVHGR